MHIGIQVSEASLAANDIHVLDQVPFSLALDCQWVYELLLDHCTLRIT